ncbi:hypothetical protein [Simkania sp.]|uniref:hypothetical protein n=1 Tax=Simkania sp. TaxID=34094 RepID=UPI003B52238D
MAGEYERIMEFFNLSPEEKEERLQEVFEDSVEYFERFKHIMINGSPEEKKQAVERVMNMKKRIEEETKKICEKTGMTEEQLAQFSNDPKNFSPGQWEAIESAKKKLDKGVGDIKKAAAEKSGGASKAEKSQKTAGGATEGKPKKKRKKPKNWIQS